MTLSETVFQLAFDMSREYILEQNDGSPKSKVLTALRIFSLQDKQIEKGELMYHSPETIYNALADSTTLNSTTPLPKKNEVRNLLEELVEEKIAEKVYVTTTFRPYLKGVSRDNLNPTKKSVSGYRIAEKAEEISINLK